MNLHEGSADNDIDAFSSDEEGDSPVDDAVPIHSPALHVVSVTADTDTAIPDIAHRVDKLEVALSMLAQSDASGQLAAQLRALTEQVETLSAQVNAIRHHLAHTVGYRAQETFQCASCGEKGMVAGLVKCTACGGETWLGWWPKS